jgi:subtilisin family serine protease
MLAIKNQQMSFAAGRNNPTDKIKFVGLLLSVGQFGLKAFCFCSFFLLAIFLKYGLAQGQTPRQSAGELLVKLRHSAQLSKTTAGRYEIAAHTLAVKLQQLGKHEVELALPEDLPPELNSIVLVRFADPHIDLSAAIGDLSLLPEVEYAQPNHVFPIATIISAPVVKRGGALDSPNDSLFASQWALQTIRAPEAWQITAGDPNILIAVIDTGADFKHPDLQTGIWINPAEDINHNGIVETSDMNNLDDDGNGFVDDVCGWDFTDAPSFPDGGDYRERDNDPTDENGHGTAVAGIIAATANNHLGIAGLAYGCRAMTLRAGTSQGLLEEDDVASAIVYAVMNGARVINMSFGDVVVSPMLRDVIRYAYNRGAVLVASAGNSATDAPHYPSGFAETISAGATNKNDQLAGFSNYGATIDVVAPGLEIWTTTLGGTYGLFSGTSASAPFVSALAGLLLSRYPDWSNEMVRAAMTNGAEDLGDPQWDRFYGAGRIDAAAALQIESMMTRAEIHAPPMDAGFAGGNVVIRGTVLGAFVSGYELSYGVGDDPKEWLGISHSANRQVIDDSLGVWPLANLADTSYTLRLTVERQNGRNGEDKIRIFLDQTPPRIDKVKMTPMIDGNLHSVLIEFATDDLCQAILWWRQKNSAANYSAAPLNYLTKSHRFNFSQQLARGEIELFLEAANRAGLTSRDTNNNQNYLLRLNDPPIGTAPFVEITFKDFGNAPDSSLTLPAGWLLGRAADFNRNGRDEIVLSVYDQNGGIGPLAIFEREAFGFAKRFATAHFGIPRDLGDGDNDGLTEILGSLGPNSFIYEATLHDAFPGALVWADTNDFWASRYADLDGDSRQEIIGRRGDRFEILENIRDNQYQFVDSLPNFTRRTNITGVPHSEVGDFDGDGRNEILFGDYDGDLYIYEATGDNRLTATWSDSLPLLDSIDFIRAGDFDGDGRTDFAAGCHSDPAPNTENEFDGRHWLFRIYRAVADNQYQPIWEQTFFGLQSPKDFDAGLGAGDIDGDGHDELFLNLFPDAYVVKIENGQGQGIWHRQPARSNTTVVANLDGVAPPEFYFSDGKILRGFQLPGLQTGAPAPDAVDARPLDATSVLLTWRPVAGAAGYAIYRGAGAEPLQLLGTTTESFFRDSSLAAEQIYRYAVAAFDAQQQPQIGPRSAEVSARPSKPPAVVAAHFFSPNHVAVQFDEPMHESVRQTALFRLNKIGEPNYYQPESAVLSRSGSEAILSFSQSSLTPGLYQVRVNGAVDVDRVPMDTTQNRANFTVAPEPPRFYLVSATLESPRQILLDFNLPVEAASVTPITNYKIKNSGGAAQNGLTVAQATAVENNAAAVRLTLGQGALGPVGRNYVLEVSGVRSASGVLLRSGEGDVIGLAIASENLNRVLIHPNPFISSLHTIITIAGLTPRALIKILDVEGRVLATLTETDGNGGVDWDTRDAQGRLTASGVYLCYVTSGTQTTVAKFVIVR